MDQQLQTSSSVGTVTVTHGSPTLITLVDEFDIANAHELDAVFAATTGDVLLDLAAVTFFCSVPLGVLLRFQQRLVADGANLTVIGVSPVMDRLLTVTGTRDVFLPAGG